MTVTELNNPVERRFQFGKLWLRRTELCAPCERPAQLLGRQSFMEAFEGNGGFAPQF
ncbi:hypothetical protein [Polynucleobacter necessarius]|uniref:hypothetical protein n=1 Tax=Polynucleobacter necessarius TaxID=576610 RepID=UPI0039E68603